MQFVATFLQVAQLGSQVKAVQVYGVSNVGTGLAPYPAAQSVQELKVPEQVVHEVSQTKLQDPGAARLTAGVAL